MAGGEPETLFAQLLFYYRVTSPSFRLQTYSAPHSMRFRRGSVLASLTGGNQLSCRHWVDVALQPCDDGRTQLVWDIRVDALLTVHFGVNRIVQECERILRVLDGEPLAADDAIGEVRWLQLETGNPYQSPSFSG